MSKPKISVIVPVYNVEDYLEEALNCLLNQSFIDNMEILMIDDGSDDESRYIIEKYALDYPNFYAYHKQNQGVSFTRNWGIDLANGEYIAFFDADDSLKNDWFEKLYEIAINNDSDIVTAPIIRLRRYNVFEGFFYKHSFKKFKKNIESTNFENVSELIWDLFITNKIYKKEFIDKNNLRFFEENRSYCDDTPFSLEAYLLSDKISVIKDTFYYWRYRENETHSATQNLTQIKNFKDRLRAIEIYDEIFNKISVDDNFKEYFYLKILNYDLYVHFSKFHLYDEEFYPEIVDKANSILKTIPQKCMDQLNSYKKILYKMVENNAISDLCELTKLESELKKNPTIPDSFNDYIDYIDFEHDALLEDLVVKKENAYIDENNLILEFSEKINYLSDSFPHNTVAKLVDENNEYLLDVESGKIFIPFEAIRDKKHSQIKIEYICDNFKKQSYLTNPNREIIELDNFNIEIGIKANRLICLDIRPTNDLTIEINDVSFKEDIFEFNGVSSKKIDEVFIQNVVSFEKVTYSVESFNNENGYEIRFKIPYDDIMSDTIRKWELNIIDTFKTIKLNKKFEFYKSNNFVYMINARNKILISADIYNRLVKLNDYFKKIEEVKSFQKELKKLNKQLKKDNKKLLNEIKKLEDKNLKLNEKNQELENKVINVNPIKTKLFKK